MIKHRYLNELEIKLKDISWPKIGNHKVIDKSQPSKFADIEDISFNLLTIEYYIQYMNDNNLYQEIIQCVETTNECKCGLLIKF